MNILTNNIQTASNASVKMDSECHDKLFYTYQEVVSLDCEWVAVIPEIRCRLVDGSVVIRDKCPLACGMCGGKSSSYPSVFPTTVTSVGPSINSSTNPSVNPSKIKSFSPSSIPSKSPLFYPSFGPSIIPSKNPSKAYKYSSHTTDKHISKIASTTTTPIRCKDDDSVYLFNDPILNCDWVKVNPNKRCKLSYRGKSFSTHCKSTCDSCDEAKCQDDDSYRFQEVESLDCKWVSVIPEIRCGITHRSEVIRDKCPLACGMCGGKSSSYLSLFPTTAPSIGPSIKTSINPSRIKSFSPSSILSEPLSSHTNASPTVLPSVGPSIKPSINPSKTQSFSPSSIPSESPSSYPSAFPTTVPSLGSSIKPSINPSINPSKTQSFYPSSIPSESHSSFPTTFLKKCHDDPFYKFQKMESLDCKWVSVIPEIRCRLVDRSEVIRGKCALTCGACDGKSSSYLSEIPSTEPSIRPSLKPSTNPSKIPSVYLNFIPSGCHDDYSYTYQKVESLDCKWVSMVPEIRCILVDRSALIRDKCPLTCGTCAGDLVSSIDQKTIKESSNFWKATPTKIFLGNPPYPSTFLSAQPSITPSLITSSMPTVKNTMVPSSAPASIPLNWSLGRPTISMSLANPSNSLHGSLTSYHPTASRSTFLNDAPTIVQYLFLTSNTDIPIKGKNSKYGNLQKQSSRTEKKSCNDFQGNFFFNGSLSSCAWVLQNPEIRCKLSLNDKYMNKLCPSTCGNCGECTDDMMYKFMGIEQKDCEWVSKNLDSRCKMFDGKSYFYSKCPLSCKLCSSVDDLVVPFVSNITSLDNSMSYNNASSDIYALDMLPDLGQHFSKKILPEFGGGNLIKSVLWYKVVFYIIISITLSSIGINIYFYRGVTKEKHNKNVQTLPHELSIVAVCSQVNKKHGNDNEKEISCKNVPIFVDTLSFHHIQNSTESMLTSENIEVPFSKEEECILHSQKEKPFHVGADFCQQKYMHKSGFHETKGKSAVNSRCPSKRQQCLVHKKAKNCIWSPRSTSTGKAVSNFNRRWYTMSNLQDILRGKIEDFIVPLESKDNTERAMSSFSNSNSIMCNPQDALRERVIVLGTESTVSQCSSLTSKSS